MQDSTTRDGVGQDASTRSGWISIGPHRVRTEGDIIHWEFQGEASLEHVQRGMIPTEAIQRHYGYALILMNAGGVARMTPEARRYMGDLAKNRRYESAAAVFNAGLMGIVLSRLIASITRLYTGKAPRFCIVGTEEEARRWLTAQRQQLREPRASETASR